MQADDLLTDCQHWFRSKKSCSTQLLEVIDDLTIAIENNQPVDMIFLDYKKAYDSATHQRLITKLNMHGISGTMLNWIRHFFQIDNKRLMLVTFFSKTSDVTSGVPQGSMLAPILPKININDLNDCVSTTCKILAGNTKLYDFSSKSSDLQKDLYTFQRWSDLWQIQFNIKNARFITLVQPILKLITQ